MANTVRGQIAYPVTDPSSGLPGMPADIVTGQDAEDVAAYVASVAGLGGDGGPPQPPTAGGPVAAAPVVAAAALPTASRCSRARAAGAATRLPMPAPSGTVGPNLDEARPSQELAVDRVTNGQGGMPPFEGQLTPEEIDAVAEYVSLRRREVTARLSRVGDGAAAYVAV